MAIRSYRIVFIFLTFLFPVVEVKAEMQSVDILSDNISAFICEEIDNINNIPLVFLKEGKNWTLTDSEELSVSKIENGFKFKSSGNEEGLGFLRKIDNNKLFNNKWDFQYLDEKSFSKTICTSQNHFVDLLIKSIAAKIIKNADLFIEN